MFLLATFHLNTLSDLVAMASRLLPLLHNLLTACQRTVQQNRVREGAVLSGSMELCVRGEGTSCTTAALVCSGALGWLCLRQGASSLSSCRTTVRRRGLVLPTQVVQRPGTTIGLPLVSSLVTEIISRLT